jgi:hypothetical protein
MDGDRELTQTVNYDESPLAELSVGEVEYRVDPGLGSAVAISQRGAGEWTWVAVGEGRWDGSRLRAKGLGHPVVSELERALVKATREFQDRYE